LGYLLGNLYLKGIDPNHSQSRGSEEIISLGQELEQLENHQIKSDSREIWGQSHQTKRHKVIIRDTQQNPQLIILKTPPRKSQQRASKITTKKDGKSTTQP
jgi:hypothetical protein